MNNPEESVAERQAQRRGGVPPWSLKAAKEFLERFEVMDEVLHLCVCGIGVLTGMPGMAVALTKDTAETEETKKQLARVESLCRLAQREISSNFAILHGQASISSWNDLESLVKDIVSDWLCNRPETLHQLPWINFKVRVGDYEPLDVEQRAAYLVELADQNVAGPLKQGVNRFEKLLETIGLSGSVADDVRQTLFELQQVRNVIVHSRGIADQKICRSCPWLNLKLGDHVLIDHVTHARYRGAVCKYATELVYRIREAFGDVVTRPSSSPKEPPLHK